LGSDGGEVGRAGIQEVGQFGRRNRLGFQKALKKVSREIKSVPQRLKPHCEQCTCGTAEAVPLSKMDFFSTLFSALGDGTMPNPGCFTPAGKERALKG